MQERLDVGGVIRRVWAIYVDQAAVLMPAAAAVFVVTGIIGALLVTSGSLLGGLVAALITVVATTLFTGMVVELVSDVEAGRRDFSTGQLVRAVTPVLAQLIGVGIAAGIAEVFGLILLLVPGLILITIWAVFVPVIVLERTAGFAALGRSRELVRGSGWQVFGVLLVLYVLVGFVVLLIDGAAASAGTGAGIVVRVVLGVLTAPFGALAAAVLYFDLRRLAGGAQPPVVPVDAPPAGSP